MVSGHANPPLNIVNGVACLYEPCLNFICPICDRGNDYDSNHSLKKHLKSNHDAIVDVDFGYSKCLARGLKDYGHWCSHLAYLHTKLFRTNAGFGSESSDQG
ncbi:hypothetical protein RF11_04185 [Thelohanellus kitauei]|uniref:Uncharacterized protein n=1 Tax=Thelohanellus kitauei TaxID=669202 RepID=A0A0C2MCH9_THEKT|nr:hypothetical protein RF11_04185 [Thelohanellus kitauei]